MLKIKCEDTDMGFKIMIKEANKKVVFTRRSPKDKFLSPDTSLTKKEEDNIKESIKRLDMPGRKVITGKEE